jgi:hypothetical protein
LSRIDSPRSPDSAPLDPIEVLDRQRAIEVIVLANLRNRFRIALFAGHDQRRVPRQKMLQRKDNQRHEKQCRDELQQSPADERQHRRGAYFKVKPTTRTMPSGSWR